jgi:uncharacterized delta-60 repeat protein
MALVAACALAPAATAHAALGEPDPAYGNGGLAVSGGQTAAVADAHLDGAGRALVAGIQTLSAGGGPPFNEGVIVRLLPDGSGDDPAWAQAGRYALPFATDSIAFAPAPNGEWIVAGIAGSDQLVLVRLGADGRQTAQSDFGPGMRSVGGVEVLGDGRIVVAGTDFNNEMAVARYTPALAIEGSLGIAGPGVAEDVAVDALGRALVAGSDAGTGVVARLQPQGTLDAGFANAGRRQIGSVLRDVDVMPDGRILLAGSERSSATLARLTADGALEEGFGTGAPGGGIVNFSGSGGPARFADALVDAVGGIYAAGDDAGRLLLYRLDDRGFPDFTLQPGGFRNVAGASVGLKVGLDAQERPHVLGGTADRPAAARLLANAAPTAALDAPASVPLGSQAILDASKSVDPEKALRRFEWDLDGDGSFETEGGTNPAISRTFTSAGAQSVGVRVTDHRGLQSSAARQVQVEPPAGPSPVLGKAFVARPTSGTIRVRRPGETKYSVLKPGEQIPEGTFVDARKGRVSITVARDNSGATDTSLFYLGRFRISQTDNSAPYTTLSMFGGSFRGCGSANPKLRAPIADAAASRKKRVVRRLWGDGKGRFRTKGRYASATVRGTKWQTIDRCDGVKLQVVRGVVDFRDLLRATKARRVRSGRTDFVPSTRTP